MAHRIIGSLIFLGFGSCIVGCGQQAWTEPVQRVDTETAQGQPTNTEIAGNVYNLYNGPRAPGFNPEEAILIALRNDNIEEFQRALFETVGEDRGAGGTITLPNATYSQANIFVFTAQGEASQDGQSTGSGTQSTDVGMEQRIRAAVEASLSATGIGQTQTTQAGTAGEGASSAQGGSMDAQIEALFNYLKANPDKIKTLIDGLVGLQGKTEAKPRVPQPTDIVVPGGGS